MLSSLLQAANAATLDMLWKDSDFFTIDVLK